MTMRPFLAASCALMLASAAHAQAPASPATPPAQTATPAEQQSTNCTPMSPKNGTGMNTRDGATVGRSNEALGDKLARSDGTLCPPSNVDPQMRAPAPETGKMPVIPPPGSPGGDQTVRPK
jgi:hypothetical protein